jgi:hypothetical protein
MPVQYDSKKIIPAPLVRIEKNYDRTGSRQKVGSRFTLTVTGTLVTCKGSPNSEGEFWTASGYPDDDFQLDVEQLNDTNQMQFLQRKMQALRYLFARDGQSFEVQPLDGTAPLKCYPIVQNISFAEGPWVDRVDYTIVLEADELFGFDTDFSKDSEDYQWNEDYFRNSDGERLYLSEVNESWSIETVEEAEDENNPYTYRLTHSVSAVGKKAYDDDGLVGPPHEQARAWVIPRLGVDAAYVNGTQGLNLSDMISFNHVKQENIDEAAGSYAVTETWVLAKAATREDFTVTISSTLESPHTNVKVEGEIVGLETRDSNGTITTSKWTAAQNKYLALIAGLIFTRAQTYSGISLNATVLSSSVGENPINGRISYSYEYDNRPSNCISGAISERVVISDNNAADVFALIPVVGRAAGPVLQNMSTITETRRTVSIEVLMPTSALCYTTSAGVTNVLAAAPTSEVDTVVQAFYQQLTGSYNQVFKEKDDPVWEPKTGRYSRTVTWVYQNCP